MRLALMLAHAYSRVVLGKSDTTSLQPPTRHLHGTYKAPTSGYKVRASCRDSDLESESRSERPQDAQLRAARRCRGGAASSTTGAASGSKLGRPRRASRRPGRLAASHWLRDSDWQAGPRALPARRPCPESACHWSAARPAGRLLRLGKAAPPAGGSVGVRATPSRDARPGPSLRLPAH
jgi:hypothetical protein